MFRMVIQKLASNRWMVACLLAGTVVAVAMVSSIPVYTKGVLQRMLTRDLEALQVDTGRFPGRFVIKVDGYALYDRDRWPRVYRSLLDDLRPEMFRDFGVSVLTHTHRLSWDYFTMLPEVPRDEEPDKRYINVEALSGIDRHVRIVHGRMFADRKAADGAIEVIVTAEAMLSADLRLGEVYLATDLTEAVPGALRFRVVGVFENSDPRDPYWFEPLQAYDESLIMDYGLFGDLFMDPERPLAASNRWYFALNYHEITVDDLARMLRGYDMLQRWFKGLAASGLDAPAIPVIQGYSRRARQLKITLWVLEAPILLMLVFYLFMVSQLIVETEKGEIAVLKSRGARSRVPLGEQLVKLGFLLRRDLERSLVLQAAELVYELLRWESGAFTFHRLEQEGYENLLVLPTALDTDQVLMEGYRRLDEWQIIEQEIDDRNLVLFPSEGRLSGRTPLTPDDASILKLIDGRNSVRDVILRSSRGSFEVCKALYRLLRAEYVRKTPVR